MINVLFVCLGDICRSPMAEAVFRDMIKEEKLANVIAVDSEATSSGHIGKRPTDGTLDKLKEFTISSKGMKGRQLEKGDFEKFDYIIGMDDSNIQNIREMLGEPDDPKIFRFLDLTDHKKDVPDPYHTGDFQETYELVIEGCRALMGKVREEKL